MAELLLRHGARPYQSHGGNEGPLIPGVWGSVGTAKLLLDRWNVPLPTDAMAGEAPLDVVKFLMERGADPQAALERSLPRILQRPACPEFAALLEFLFFDKHALPLDDAEAVQLHGLLAAKRELAALRQHTQAFCDAVKDIPFLELPASLTVQETMDAVEHHWGRQKTRGALQKAEAEARQQAGNELAQAKRRRQA